MNKKFENELKEMEQMVRNKDNKKSSTYCCINELKDEIRFWQRALNKSNGDRKVKAMIRKLGLEIDNGGTVYFQWFVGKRGKYTNYV